MRYTSLHFSSLFIFLIVFVYTTSAQENYEIRKIEFRGNKTLDDDFLKENMSLKELSYFGKLFTKQEPSLYSQEFIKTDQERLTKIYQSEGFLNVRVHFLQPRLNDQKQTGKLIFAIEEGIPVAVDKLDLKITEADRINPDSLWQKALHKLELRQGVRFRDESLLNDLAVVENAFRNIGYAYAKASYSLSLQPEKSLVSISYTVSPGPICLVGETSISGNKHVSERFIRKLIEYDEAEKYNSSLLSETREELYRMQLFRVVSVLPETNAKTLQNPIPVKIYIEEAPRVSTRYGIGYGTEDKFRTFLDLNYRGFLSGARRINLYIKHSALEPYSVNLKWIQPRFFVKNSSITINPFIARNSEPGYETRSYGLNIPVSYQFNESLTSTLTYYLGNVKQTVESGDPELNNMESNKFLYNKSGILFSTLFNSSNDKFSPNNGVNFSFGYKVNGHLFSSDFNYNRIWVDFRKYQKIEGIVLALRVMGGGISSADSSGFIPVEDRFYSGGSNSVRGWNRSELGPKRESGTPLGGKSILESNVELRIPIFERVSAVVFVDAGNVWKESFNYRLNELAYAGGTGLRIETPIGPIRLDVGLPLWNEKKSPQFFISVGQAF